MDHSTKSTPTSHDSHDQLRILKIKGKDIPHEDLILQASSDKEFVEISISHAHGSATQLDVTTDDEDSYSPRDSE